jgi:hypothetical protein
MERCGKNEIVWRVYKQLMTLSMSSGEINIFSKVSGGRTAAFKCANNQMVALTIARCSDGDKIAVLEQICEHFNVDSRRIVKQIRKDNYISDDNKFWDEVETKGLATTFEVCMKKRKDGKMW